MITENIIGKTLINFGFTLSDGSFRDTVNITDVVDAMASLLRAEGIEVGE